MQASSGCVAVRRALRICARRLQYFGLSSRSGSQRIPNPSFAENAKDGDPENQKQNRRQKAGPSIRWWGPKGFTLPSCELDLRVGGKFRYVMRGPDGTDYPSDGEFIEIIKPERIPTRGTIHDDPAQVIITTVNFLEENGKTKVVVNQSYTFESAATAGAPIGWSQMLDRLVVYLAKQ